MEDINLNKAIKRGPSVIAMSQKNAPKIKIPRGVQTKAKINPLLAAVIFDSGDI